MWDHCLQRIVYPFSPSSADWEIGEFALEAGATSVWEFEVMSLWGSL